MSEPPPEDQAADTAWAPMAGYAATERLAHKVEEALEEARKPVVDLIAYSRRNRMILWWLAVTTAIDLAATGVSIVAVVRATEATHRVATSCNAGNQFKALDLARWRFILDQSKLIPPTGTPAEQAAAHARMVSFETFIIKADTPRNC